MQVAAWVKYVGHVLCNQRPYAVEQEYFTCCAHEVGLDEVPTSMHGLRGLSRQQSCMCAGPLHSPLSSASSLLLVRQFDPCLILDGVAPFFPVQTAGREKTEVHLWIGRQECQGKSTEF